MDSRDALRATSHSPGLPPARREAASAQTAPAALRLRLTATSPSASILRTELADWLRHLGAASSTIFDLQLACTEVLMIMIGRARPPIRSGHETPRNHDRQDHHGHYARVRTLPTAGPPPGQPRPGTQPEPHRGNDRQLSISTRTPKVARSLSNAEPESASLRFLPRWKDQQRHASPCCDLPSEIVNRRVRYHASTMRPLPRKRRSPAAIPAGGVSQRRWSRSEKSWVNAPAAANTATEADQSSAETHLPPSSATPNRPSRRMGTPPTNTHQRPLRARRRSSARSRSRRWS